MTHEELVEIAIRAGCTEGDIHLRCTYPDCECRTTPRMVKAALSALRAKGVAMVPRVATGDMEVAFDTYEAEKRDAMKTMWGGEVWFAMLAAGEIRPEEG